MLTPLILLLIAVALPMCGVRAAAPAPAFTLISANTNGTIRGPANFLDANWIGKSRTFTNVAQMLTTPGIPDGTLLTVEGYSTSADGGGWLFVYDSSGTGQTNQYNCFAYSTGRINAVAGGNGWRVFPTIDAMLAFNPAIGVTNAIVVSGSSSSDGRYGLFAYDPSSGISTNLGMVFKPNNYSGRWLRQYDGTDINVIWFGAVPSQSTDSTAAFKDALWFAAKPTYGPISGASSGYAAMGVFVPPGEYKTTATLTNYGVRFFGKSAHYSANYNADTVVHSKHGGHFMVFDYGGVTGPLLVADYRVGSIEDLAIEGYPETFPGTKVAITAVTDRTHFNVSPGSLPTIDAVNPQMNVAFFYDDQGRWLGSGQISAVNSMTGEVTLTFGSDVYATVGGSVLRTADKVVFTPTIASESNVANFADPASAGPCGIFFKASYAGVGHGPTVKNVLVSNFHVGLRVGPGLLERRVKDLKVQQCKYAGILYPREYNSTDSPYEGMTYIACGYRSDYGTAFSNAITNPQLSNTTVGWYGLGPLERIDMAIVELASWAQMIIQRGLGQHIGYICLDLCTRHGLIVQRGYSPDSAASLYDNTVDIGAISIKTPFNAGAKYQLDSVHGDRYAISVPNVGASNPALLSIGVVSINDGGLGDFSHGVFTVAGVGNKVTIGRIASRWAAGTWYTGQAPFISGIARNLTAAETYTGIAETAPDELTVANQGQATAKFSTTGLTVEPLSGSVPLTIVRHDTGNSASFVMGTADAYQFRNDTRGNYFNSGFGDASGVQFTIGANGTTSAPRVSVLTGEVANGGTNVPPSDFYFLPSRGTGNSTGGGRLIFQTPDTTVASGTTVQNGITRVLIRREGQMNFVPQASAPANSLQGDIYYDSTEAAFRVHNGAGYKNVRTAKLIKATATLDFPSTAAQSESGLTVSVPGAVVGDVVHLGIPAAATTAGSCYTAWISATDVATIRFSNYGAVTRDPPSGVFTIAVEQY